MSFTGSTAVGKQLAALAGLHMKRTMELGGHAPVIVFEDADLDVAIEVLAAASSATPARYAFRRHAFWCTRSIYDRFVEKFIAAVQGGEGR